MDKLKEILNKLTEKFKSFSKNIKIAIIISIITVVIVIISVMFYNSSNKYKVLFSNLNSSDAQYLLGELTDRAVDMKVEGSTILVPTEMVDELRLELASNLSGGSEGYELIDNSGSFGMTDEEFKLNKLRAQQGELEKTIKYFSQVNTVRVHITEAKDSVFVDDKEPGKAAVYIDLNSGNTLTQDQVKSIVALVSASTSNIPEENVQVIDSKMNLLTEGLNADSNEISSSAIQSQFDLQTQYENKLEKNIVKMLEPVIGKNKVTSSVNVDMDFDSKQKTETIIDPNKVIISQQTIKEINSSGTENTSGSVIDNNMTPTIEGENDNENSSSREDVSTNYEVGSVETQTISAPGEVKRLTATVFVNGNLDANVQIAVENAVANAIGINQERGDSISIIGMQFDTLSNEISEEDQGIIDGLLKAEKTKELIVYGIVGILALIILVVIFALFRRSSKKKKEEKTNLLNVVIDDIIEEPIEHKKINFEPSNEQVHVENEIKKYATEKPEQVADIVKSWLAENER